MGRVRGKWTDNVLLFRVQRGKLYCNEAEISSLPRWGAMTKAKCYLLSSSSGDAMGGVARLARWLQDGDTYSGPTMGNPMSVAVRTNSGRPYSIRLADSWGGRGMDAETFMRTLLDAEDVADSLGLRMRSGAGGLARDIFFTRCPKGERIEAPPPVAGMSIESAHVGPMVAHSVGRWNGLHLDRKGAYLTALKGELPVGRSWRIDEKPSLEGEGIARIIASWVGSERLPVGWGQNDGANIGAPFGTIAPIPVRLDTSVLWGPYSRSLVTASKGWIRRSVAETGGAYKVRNVLESMSCETAPWYAETARMIEGLPKSVGKPLYQRTASAVGRGNGGWFTWEVGADKPLEMPGEWWRWKGEAGRPDVESWVYSANAELVAREADRAAANGQLVAAHLDAIFVLDGYAPGEDTGPWVEKGRGPLEWYNVGSYRHDGVRRGNRDELPEDTGLRYASPIQYGGSALFRFDEVRPSLQWDECPEGGDAFSYVGASGAMVQK